MGVADALRKAVDAFGVGDAGGYDGYDEYEDYEERDAYGDHSSVALYGGRQPRGAERPARPSRPSPSESFEWTDRAERAERLRRFDPSAPPPPPPVHRDDYRESNVRPLSLVRAPQMAFGIVEPQDFDDAQRIADRLRAGASVMVDMSGCRPDLLKRLTDFCSGLCYALDGTLQYVDKGILLLTPSGVEISGSATFGLMEKGFFNQM